MVAELAGWDGFYGIVGSAAGALIGLQFVVLTLIAERPAMQGAEANAAFSTPTIVHFSATLLLSALLRAPWRGIVPVASLWAIAGFSGAVYTMIVARRMRTQTIYRPEFEDWLCHVALPLAAYFSLVVSAIAAPARTHEALFGAAGASLLLLLVGIHNAWDAVAYHVFVSRPRWAAQGNAAKPSAGEPLRQPEATAADRERSSPPQGS